MNQWWHESSLTAPRESMVAWKLHVAWKLLTASRESIVAWKLFNRSTTYYYSETPPECLEETNVVTWGSWYLHPTTARQIKLCNVSATTYPVHMHDTGAWSAHTALPCLCQGITHTLCTQKEIHVYGTFLRQAEKLFLQTDPPRPSMKCLAGIMTTPENGKRCSTS